MNSGVGKVNISVDSAEHVVWYYHNVLEYHISIVYEVWWSYQVAMCSYHHSMRLVLLLCVIISQLYGL